MVEMFRAFRIAGQNFFLPPGVPRERVQILADAMRKTLSDPEFLKEYQKLSGEAASPLAAEALEKVIKELPRDANVVELFNKLGGADPLPEGDVLLVRCLLYGNTASANLVPANTPGLGEILGRFDTPCDCLSIVCPLSSMSK